MIRIISVALLVAGLLLCGFNIRDEIRGKTSVYSPSGFRSSISALPYKEDNHKDPKSFRNAMAYQWIYAMLLLALGIAGQSLQRHQDKLDPFSSTFNFPDTPDEKSNKT